MESARTFLWLTFGALCMFLFVEWNEQSARTTFTAVEQNQRATPKTEYNDTAEASSSSFQDNLPTIDSNTVGVSEAVAQRSETAQLIAKEQTLWEPPC